MRGARRSAPEADGRFPLRDTTVSSLLGLGDCHVLEQLPLVARLPHGVETVVNDLRFGRSGVSETESAFDSSRGSLLPGCPAGDDRGASTGGRSDRRAGGWAYLFTEERAGDDDGDVHARALRGGVEARDGAVAVRLDRGRAGAFCRLSRARSVEARLRIPAVAKRHAPTSRSCRTLRTWCPRLCLRGSLRALRTLPARGRGGATQT